jgi:glycerol-3-phosphate cytidylyltransferase
MKKAVVVGGGNGIGLAVVHQLLERDYAVTVFDREGTHLPQNERVTFVQFNLLHQDFSVFDGYQDAEALFITAGFGRLALFQDLQEQEIINGMRVNAEAVIRLLKHYYSRLAAPVPFYCGIMGSISGWINSPLFSVYSASKAAVCRFTEALNTELEYIGSPNRILNASPGNVPGTRFDGAEQTRLDAVRDFAATFVDRTFAGDTLYIPDYDTVYSDVMRRSRENPQQFGLESIQYKKNSGRMAVPTRPQVKVGYLSGTFDLFHIGHLNLLRRAKQYCDYLVVGVHKDASHKGKQTFIPFEERKEIVESISYVDRAIESCREDVDVYKNGIVKYDYLFVGSDYQGTERFLRYEEYFADKGVQIVYFPYTTGTSSTQLRKAIEK